MEKYPEYIMIKLRQRLGLEADDTSGDEFIMRWNRNEVFNEVCTWEGLINYGSTIQGWIKDIYNIDFSELGVS